MKHELLSADWKQVFASLDMQSMWSILHFKMLFLIDKCIPSRIFWIKCKTQMAQFINLKTH